MLSCRPRTISIRPADERTTDDKMAGGSDDPELCAVFPCSCANGTERNTAEPQTPGELRFFEAGLEIGQFRLADPNCESEPFRRWRSQFLLQF